MTSAVVPAATASVYASQAAPTNASATTSALTAAFTVAVIFTGALAGALVPALYLPVTPRVTRMGNALAAGVLASAALVHLMPGAHAIMQQAVGHSLDFPYDGVATLFGVTVVFLLDTFLRQTARTSPHTPPSLHYKPIGVEQEEQADSNAPRPTLALVLAVSLSFHSVLEGLTLGASLRHVRQFNVIALAIVTHKVFAAAALGSSLAAAHSPRSHRIVSCTAFALSTPLGALAGMALAAAASGVVAAALSCVSTGVFLYVGLVELLADEVRLADASTADRTSRAALFVAAAGCMSVLALWI